MFTITGNLLAETTFLLKYPREGSTVRAGGASFQVGGKGVNAARAWRRIARRKAFAAIFPAGKTGERCMESLAKEDFCQPLPFWINGETRAGLVCRNPESGLETTFLGADLPIPPKAFDAALRGIAERAASGDIVAFCGSFPGWKINYAEKLGRLCRSRGLKLCVDTYGAPLIDIAAKCDIFILKINRAEFCGALGARALTLKASAHAAKKLRAKYFVVSNSAGKIYAAGEGKAFAITPPKIVREVSATGCGDAMTASLAAELSAGKDFCAALKISAARASASAEIPEVSRWSEPRARKLLSKIL